MTGNPSAPTEHSTQEIFNRSWDSKRNVLKVADFGLAVAMGLIPGITSVNKFGRNIEVDSGVAADIWDGGHTLASGGVSLIWVAPTQARIHDIVSSSASDDGDPVGVGARTIRIFGLVDWDTAEVSEDITMNGTTNVPTAAYVIIHRMQVLTKGATNVNVGIIKATARTDNTITAQIRAGEGQTQMAIYGIPSTQKGYRTLMYAHTNKGGGAGGVVDMSLKFNPDPKTDLLNFITKHTWGLQTTGSSDVQMDPVTLGKVEGPGIVKIQALSGTNDMDVSAGFSMYMVDN